MEKNIGKSLSSKYTKKLLVTAKELATDSLKTASNRAIQKKTAEATGYLAENKIAEKTANTTKTNTYKDPEKLTTQIPQPTRKEEQIPPEKRQQIIDELRLL